MIPEITKVHFTDTDLINPTNPITINVIGSGGTGSKVLTALLEMHQSLIALGHAGLSVRLWDDDTITEANIGRQRFASCELGLYKSVALINRANRWTGTNWKAETKKFSWERQNYYPENVEADIYISCVDSVKARFEIAYMLTSKRRHNSKLKYLIDFGNSKDSGQVILSTIGNIRQPTSKKYETVANLPLVTEEFADLLQQSEAEDDTPSCSLAEALEKQDLYINGALAQLGCSLLWGLFRNGLTFYRGFFLNLKDFRSQPIPLP
ncbi:PRTRC system ThiF family protein [Chryseobacterium wanjuense]|uniref:PRTRC system ThiF family protein n=1 Tax=Chryseobacterium wanjuense TaxID=356305 RepID=A0A1I0QD32_9FLAO|nr:PRTRC system ThiF family protein [Chryseobacterium wanjuense]SEW24804.1 PRTRC system ThiF family protein [Chryseobacterium wanjuense]